jgi:hypothetical protein
MIKLPKFKNLFEYENGFYLTCNVYRIAKLLLHYELLKKTVGISGDIVEFGVFKGISFVNLAAMRDIFGMQDKKIIGFDTYDDFPETLFEQDKTERDFFIKSAGSQSISVAQLKKIMDFKKIQNYELISGNILETLPEYMKDNKKKYSFVNLDTDVYEPAVCVLNNVYIHLSIGGVMVFDDYARFPGETKAVDDFLLDKKEKPKQLILGGRVAWYIEKQ